MSNNLPTCGNFGHIWTTLSNNPLLIGTLILYVGPRQLVLLLVLSYHFPNHHHHRLLYHLCLEVSISMDVGYNISNQVNLSGIISQIKLILFLKL